MNNNYPDGHIVVHDSLTNISNQSEYYCVFEEHSSLYHNAKYVISKYFSSRFSSLSEAYASDLVEKLENYFFVNNV